MRKIALGIMMIAILMLTACSNKTTDKQAISSTGAITNKNNIATPTAQQVPVTTTNSDFDYVKTYQGEDHNQILYGELELDLWRYHIVTDKRVNNIETFQCEINMDLAGIEDLTHMTISIQPIEKREFLNQESIISYLSELLPNYDNISIYNEVSDDSGIISLYRVTAGAQTKFVVCYSNSWYMIETNNEELDMDLFNNDPTVNCEVIKQKVECGNSYNANVITTFYKKDNKIDYKINQGKDSNTYTGELSGDKNSEYNFTIKNEKGNQLLSLSTHESDINEIIKILVINRDGYADIQFMNKVENHNSSNNLYIWNEQTETFEKVKCDATLSHYEVHDGFILNWTKDDEAVLIQKLVWVGKSLKIDEVSKMDSFVYKIEQEEFKKNKISINYPRIVDMSDKEKQKKLNFIIKEEAYGYLNKYFSEEEQKQYIIDIDYRISLKNGRLLSIQYSGEEEDPGAAHPGYWFYTTNLDMEHEKILELADMVDINEDFVSKFKKSKMVSPKTVKKKDILESKSDIKIKEWVKDFQHSDSESGEVCCYLTENSLGISIPTAHVVGEHAEFEISYKDLISYKLTGSEVWKHLLQ